MLDNFTAALVYNLCHCRAKPDKNQFDTAGFFLLERAGEASPKNISASPPQKKKQSFTEKKLQLFQIKIFFDDYFKESMKVTNVQKCDFSQS